MFAYLIILVANNGGDNAFVFRDEERHCFA